jgi:hypothetical protein
VPCNFFVSLNLNHNLALNPSNEFWPSRLPARHSFSGGGCVNHASAPKHFGDSALRNPNSAFQRTASTLPQNKSDSETYGGIDTIFLFDESL